MCRATGAAGDGEGGSAGLAWGMGILWGRAGPPCPLLASQPLWLRGCPSPSCAPVVLGLHLAQPGHLSV